MSALLRKRTYDHPSSETSVIQITDVEIVWLTRHTAITNRKHIDRNSNDVRCE
jgi:hypothetical protein